jgi:hypothetical protein
MIRIGFFFRDDHIKSKTLHFVRRKCQDSDLDELMPMVNETYEVETGDSGIGFKCVKRLISRNDALTYLSGKNE